jgi:biopolymer transport protein ExbD
MPRVKVPRKSTAVDMTAMCDVAFLLLTFFILTATARQPDPLDITTPSSTVQFKVPDKDLGIISIGKGKVFFEIIGRDVKILSLQKMGTEYGIKFTPEEEKKFAVVAAFGMPVNSIKQFLSMDAETRKKSGIESGIPTQDTTQNGELARWLRIARQSTGELHGVDMRVSIKADNKEEYPTLRKVVNVMQGQKVNKFSLITSSEGAAK